MELLKIIFKIKKITIKIINHLFNFVIFKVFNAEIETQPIINGRIHLRNYGKFKLEENIKINSGAEYNPIGGQTETQIIVKKGAKLKIGRNSGISNSTIVCHKSIEIDEKVYIGGNCKIYDTDFHSLNIEERLSKNDTDIKTAPVSIKSGAFIGAHSIVLKGVTIGENSVIGAGSVVTRDIPNNEVWAGNPVKFIKKLE